MTKRDRSKLAAIANNLDDDDIIVSSPIALPIPMPGGVASATVSSQPNADTDGQRCLISVWSTWYCILVVSLHVYLVNTQVAVLLQMYADLRRMQRLAPSSTTATAAATAEITANVSSSSNNGDGIDIGGELELYYELVARLCMVALCVCFTLFFLIATLKQTGNYANDGVKFGRDFFREQLHHQAGHCVNNGDIDAIDNNCRQYDDDDDGDDDEDQFQLDFRLNLEKAADAVAQNNADHAHHPLSSSSCSTVSHSGAGGAGSDSSFVDASSSPATILASGGSNDDPHWPNPRKSSSPTNTTTAAAAPAPAPAAKPAQAAKTRPAKTATRDTKRSKQRCSCCVRTCASVGRLCTLLWRHFLPLGAFFHLVAIQLLLLSQLIFRFDATKRAIERPCLIGGSSSSSITRWILPYSTTTANNNSISSTRLNLTCFVTGYVNWIESSATTTTTSIHSSSSSGLWSSAYDAAPLLTELFVYRFELISAALAFVSLYLRYGSVFWHTSKPLALLITLVGAGACVQQLAQLYALAYVSERLQLEQLLRWAADLTLASSYISQRTTAGSSSVNSSSISSSSSSYINLALSNYGLVSGGGGGGVLVRNRYALLFLYGTLSALVLLTATPVYVLAYLKYQERFAIEEALFVRSLHDLVSGGDHRTKTTTTQTTTTTTKTKTTATTAVSASTRVASPTSTVDARCFGRCGCACCRCASASSPLPSPSPSSPPHRSNSPQGVTVASSACCFNYCPHLIATMQLVLICACKLPGCYDAVVYFNNYRDLGVLLGVVVEIAHTLLLLLVWLLLTLRTEWSMHLQTVFSICHWTYHVRMSRCQRSLVAAAAPNTRRNKKPTDTVETMRKNAQCHFVTGVAGTAAAAAVTDNTAASVCMATPQSLPTPLRQHRMMLTGARPLRHQSLVEVDEQQTQQQHQQPPHQQAPPLYNADNDGNGDYAVDYLLNSETLYRNEIRKSIRNVMQREKRASAANYDTYHPHHHQQQQQQRLHSTNGNDLSRIGAASSFYYPAVATNQCDDSGEQTTTTAMPRCTLAVVSAAAANAAESNISNNMSNNINGDFFTRSANVTEQHVLKMPMGASSSSGSQVTHLPITVSGGVGVICNGSTRPLSHQALLQSKMPTTTHAITTTILTSTICESSSSSIVGGGSGVGTVAGGVFGGGNTTRCSAHFGGSVRPQSSNCSSSASSSTSFRQQQLMPQLPPPVIYLEQQRGPPSEYESRV